MGRTETLREKPSLNTVKKAISVVLSETFEADRRASTEWLESLIKSPFAWEICDQLLLEQSNIQICYFAAEMLRLRISEDYEELTGESKSLTLLRNSIVMHLQSTQDQDVHQTLCSALADLSLLSSWQEPIDDLAEELDIFDTSAKVDILSSLRNKLIFVQVLDQMRNIDYSNIANKESKTKMNKKDHVNYLRSHCGIIIGWWSKLFKDLDQLSSKASENLTQPKQVQTNRKVVKNAAFIQAQLIDQLVGKTFLCAASWMKMFTYSQIRDCSTLTQVAFKYLADIQSSDCVHNGASLYLTSMFDCCAEFKLKSSDESPTEDNIFLTLVVQVASLKDNFNLYSSGTNKNVQRCINHAKIVTSMAKTSLLQCNQSKLDTSIQHLLVCLKHEDLCVGRNIFEFCIKFGKFLKKEVDCLPYKEHINNIVMALMKRCQLDTNLNSVLAKNQDIYVFREECRDIIKAIVQIEMVDQFLADNKVLDLLKLDLINSNWEQAESILYLVSCLAEWITKSDIRLDINILESLFIKQTNQKDLKSLLSAKKMPYKIGLSEGETHPQIVATTLNIIRSMREFLAYDAQFILLASSYILPAMAHPTYRVQLIEHSIEAFKKIKELNENLQFTSDQELLDVVRDLWMHINDFDEKAEGEIMWLSGQIMGTMSTKEKDDFLVSILQTTINSLRDALNSLDSINNTDPIIKQLRRLIKFYNQAQIEPQHLSELKNFVATFETEIWSAISNYLKNKSDREPTVALACQTIQVLLSCTKLSWLIRKLAEMIGDIDRKYPWQLETVYLGSSFLYMLMRENLKINQHLFAIFAIIIYQTSIHLSGSERELGRNDGTITDLILEVSMGLLRLDEPEVKEFVTDFLEKFVNAGSGVHSPAISDAISNQLGSKLTHSILQECLLNKHRPIDEGARILLALKNFDKDQFYIWLDDATISLPKTNKNGIEFVKLSQSRKFKDALNGATTVEEVAKRLRKHSDNYKQKQIKSTKIAKNIFKK